MQTPLFLLVPSLGLLSLVACNEAPTAPTIALQPGEPVTTDDLVVQFLSLSTDGDSKDEVVHRFVWFVDGDARDDLTTDTVPASETIKGQTWKVVVIPNDGTVDGPSAEASVTIANSLPVATLTLGPAAPATGENLVASAAATDADEDAVTFAYAWTRDGQPTEHTEESLPARATSHGELWEVTVTPNDGEDDGEPVKAGVSIVNTAPVAMIAVAPAEPVPTDDLVAIATATDADDDEVAFTYAWTRDGGPTEFTGSIVPSSAIAAGETWEVTVTPNDGEADGASVTAAVTIGEATCGSLVFDGRTAYATAPDAPSLDLRTRATLAAWVRLDAASGAPHSAVFVSKGNATNSSYAWQLWALYTESQAIVSLSGGGGNPQCQAEMPLGVGEWHHVASTYDDAVLTLYVDGVATCSMGTTVDPGDTPSPVYLGAWPGAPDRYRGALADVALYDVALTEDEVAALAAGGRPVLASSLMAWWPLDDGAGGVAMDMSGNGNHATLMGGATWSTECANE
jgi:hypothetical protein